MQLTITSSAFKNNESIPAKYTCDAENISPPITISDIPEGTVSLALLMRDADVPKALQPEGTFDHLVVYSIPFTPGGTEAQIPEGAQALPFGLNGSGKEGYIGPCPPPEYEPSKHRYFFKVYALGTELSFLAPPTLEEVKKAMEGYVLASGELIGTYDRKEN
ncbi:YbhB/YbcL family Raf kinase inhibitor-like protein [Patescibacteria group bacterium]|nr:YbhB/YbcL family Raf kinase inhibitor-like protein [Patescibacteria group bacterium]